MLLMSIWSELNRFQSKINGGNIEKNKVKKVCTAGFLIFGYANRYWQLYQVGRVLPHSRLGGSCLIQREKGLRGVLGELSRGFFLN